MTITYGSLFCGIGGADKGFDDAGLVCKWQCEIDKDANKVLQKHWPGAVRFGDVRRQDFSARQWSCDVLVGGSPCQDTSLCGNRNGLTAARSSLFFELLRVAEEAGPRWLVFENTPGLLTDDGGRSMHTVMQGMADIGYVPAYRVLDARYFGVGQRRPRVFVVAHLGTWLGPARVLFDRISLPNSAGQRQEVQPQPSQAAPGRPEPFFFQTRIARNGRGQPSNLAPAITSYEGCGMHSDAKPHLVTEHGIRRPTPIEYERLSGFPDNWTAGVRSRARMRLLGNCIVPAVAKWLGMRISVVDSQLEDDNHGH